MTSLGKLLEKRFPGGKEQIVTRPISMRQPFDAARRGEDDCANIPWMLPDNAELANNRVKKRLKNGFNLKKKKDRQEYAQRLIASSSQQGSDELAAYRTFELTNDIMAAPFALAAFQQVNLSDDEMPMIVRPRSRNYQRFTVRTQSIDGGAREAQWRTTKDVSFFEIESIATDRVEYPLLDIQQGDVDQSAAINVELKYDMDMKIDALALTNINAAQTASGLRALLSIHPNIVQANIPDTNYLDLNTAFPGNDDVLTLPKLKAILNHVAMLQGVGGPLEGLTMQTVMISPQNLRDSWDFTDLVSEAGFATEAPQSITEQTRNQIFSTGQFTSAWGFNWTWMPNPQLVKGRMLIFMNQPLGWFFTKTQMDRTYVWNESNSPDHAESNMGEIMYRRVLTFVVPDIWKYRILIVDL